MPEYDYQCEKCERMFVIEHPMAHRGKVKCPHCGSLSTVKVFHAAGVVFKGSGFYVTDSGNGHRAATSVGENGKSETKPAESSTTGEDKQAADTPSTNGKAPAAKDSKGSKPSSKP
jgi:putative FmdB family regulatory protein